MSCIWLFQSRRTDHCGKRGPMAPYRNKLEVRQKAWWDLRYFASGCFRFRSTRVPHFLRAGLGPCTVFYTKGLSLITVSRFSLGLKSSTAIGLYLETLTFWIPFIFPFNQQKVKHFLLGDLQHPSKPLACAREARGAHPPHCPGPRAAAAECADAGPRPHRRPVATCFGLRERGARGGQRKNKRLSNTKLHPLGFNPHEKKGKDPIGMMTILR